MWQRNRKIIYGLIVALMLLALVLARIINSSASGQELEVVFLDVGQGDAILVQSGSQQVLIDGGSSGERLLQKVGEFMPFWDRQIETVIVTHPDQDHIGGLPRLFENYLIANVVRTHQQSESQIFRALEVAIRSEGAQEVEAKRGVKIMLDKMNQGEIIYPDRSLSDNAGDETNQGSVVIRWHWKDTDFLMTGDLPDDSEAAVLESCGNCDVDILKVSHHGSKYATTDAWLDATKPEIAIISAGKNNSYGHPASDTLARLAGHGTKILETSKSGDLVFICKESDNNCYLERR